MVEILGKFESHVIKIARVKSILLTKSINFFLILSCVGVRCDGGPFSVHSPFIEKSMRERIFVIKSLQFICEFY